MKRFLVFSLLWLLAAPAVAQTAIVTDPSKFVQWVVDIDLANKRVCSQYAYRDPDKYKGYWIVQTPLDLGLIAAEKHQLYIAAITARDWAALWGMRTHSMDDPAMVAVMQPCYKKWVPLIGPWVVPPLTGSTTRPSYNLKADGTRAASNGTTLRAPVDSTCNCAKRSVEPAGSTSTYCEWAGGPKAVVALCKEVK